MAQPARKILTDIDELAAAALDVAHGIHGKRGEEIVVLRVRELLPIASFFVLATSASPRVAKTLAEEAERRLDRHGLPRIGVHGLAEGRWVCLDFAEIVVHIFDRESRRQYDLENLWSGAPRLPFEPPTE